MNAPEQPTLGRTGGGGKLRMAELVRRSGVPKSTILHYLSEGLLPEPERPKPNVALYDEVCVELIAYIRSAQEIHRYPLDWIRGNVKHILAGTNTAALLLIGQRLVGDATEVVTMAEVAATLSISINDIDRFVAAGLLFPLDADHLDSADRTMLELLVAADRSGYPPEAFANVVESIRQFDLATQRLFEERLTIPLEPATVSLIVEVLTRMRPYLTRRLLQQREL